MSSVVMVCVEEEFSEPGVGVKAVVDDDDDAFPTDVGTVRAWLAGLVAPPPPPAPVVVLPEPAPVKESPPRRSRAEKAAGKKRDIDAVNLELARAARKKGARAAARQEAEAKREGKAA